MVRERCLVGVREAAGGGKRLPAFAGERTGEDMIDGLAAAKPRHLVGLRRQRDEDGGKEIEFGRTELRIEIAGQQNAIGRFFAEMGKDGLNLALAGLRGEVEMGGGDGEGLAVGHAESGIDEDARFVGHGEAYDFPVLGSLFAEQRHAVFAPAQRNGLSEEGVGISGGFGEVGRGVALWVPIAPDVLVDLLQRHEIGVKAFQISPGTGKVERLTKSVFASRAAPNVEGNVTHRFRCLGNEKAGQQGQQGNDDSAKQTHDDSFFRVTKGSLTENPPSRNLGG